MKQYFPLYTWQNPDWDITKEKRDPSYGYQRWGDTWDKLQLLYDKLEKEIGTLDFVWCFTGYYTKNNHWMDDISRLWELSVPSSKIFQFLDSNIWEAMRQSVEVDKQPEDICWNQLLVERNEGIKRLSAGNNGNITPLVLVPLCTTIRVDDRSKFSTGLAIPVKYEDLPTSECEAKRCRDEGYQRKFWRQRNKIKRTHLFDKLTADEERESKI